MFRALLLLLLGVLLLAGGDPVSTDLVADGAHATQADGDDCCPPRPDGHDQQGDCCDYDFGQCCAASASALASADIGATRARPPALELRPWLPPDLLRNRATGPPPTPPPIG